MTVALGLLVAAVLLGVLGPVLLRRVVTPEVRPGLALAGWVSAVTAMLGTASVAAVLLVSSPSGVDGLLGVANSCVNALRDGRLPWDDVARLGPAAAVFGLLTWVASVAVRRTARYRRWRHEHLSVLGSVCRCEESVFWLDEAAPVAYSVGGRRGTVVATSGVRRLGASERAAVLAHERAHLRGRHHLLVLTADILAAALPFVPLCRRAPGNVRVLVELAADDAAARRHGPGPVRAALLAMSTAATPGAALAMSRDAAEARLMWLSGRRVALRWLPARVDYALAALLTLVPTAASVAVFAGAVALYCLAVAGGAAF